MANMSLGSTNVRLGPSRRLGLGNARFFRRSYGLPTTTLYVQYNNRIPIVRRLPLVSVCRRFFLSSEYYLGTVPFKADPIASTLRLEFMSATGNDCEDFTIDIKNKPFSTPGQVAVALSAEIKHRIEICDLVRKPSMTVDYDGKRFSFSLKKLPRQDFHLRLGKDDPTSILTKLGFNDDALEVEPDKKQIAQKPWKIGNGNEHGGRSIHDQRIRSDPGFGVLRAKFRAKFEKKRKTGKRKGRAGALPDDDDDLGEIGKRKGKAVALHDGHLLVAEYLFSLVFLSMYRDEGATMQINNAVELASGVNDDSVNKFNESLRLVCDFDVGTTDEKGPCSIGTVMNFVKEVK